MREVFLRALPHDIATALTLSRSARSRSARSRSRSRPAFRFHSLASFPQAPMAAFFRRQTTTGSMPQEEHRSPPRTVLTFRPSVSELPLCDSVLEFSAGPSSSPTSSGPFSALISLPSSTFLLMCAIAALSTPRRTRASMPILLRPMFFTSSTSGHVLPQDTTRSSMISLHFTLQLVHLRLPSTAWNTSFPLKARRFSQKPAVCRRRSWLPPKEISRRWKSWESYVALTVPGRLLSNCRPQVRRQLATVWRLPPPQRRLEG